MRDQYLLDREVARRELVRHLGGVIGEIYRGDEFDVRQREYAVREYLRAVQFDRGRSGGGQFGPATGFQGCDDAGPKPELNDAPLRNTVFTEDDDLSCIDFSRADFNGAILISCHLEGTILIESRFHFADLRGAFLTGADLSGAELFGTVLSGADLRGASLRGAQLAPPDVQRDEATGLAPETVKLQSALLAGADLGGVSFCYVDLRGVDLSEAKNIRQEQLNGATVDGTTRLPPDLRPPKQDQPCPTL